MPCYMQENDLLSLFIFPLQEADVPYMVTGSVAGMLYGEPRLTNDVDVVVSLDDSIIRRLSKLYPSVSFYCPPVEVLHVENRRGIRGHFNVIHLESGSKADFYIAYNPLHDWGMKQKRLVQLEGVSMWVAPPEYVIVRKLEYYREGGSEKHLRDIAGMLAVSGAMIDRDIVSEWCRKLGLESQWQSVLHFNPDRGSQAEL